MGLTLKQEFCLNRLSESDFCAFDLSKMAESAGVNKNRYRYEWADAPLRELRHAGIVELTGEMSRAGRRIHRITAKGRDILARK